MGQINTDIDENQLNTYFQQIRDKNRKMVEKQENLD